MSPPNARIVAAAFGAVLRELRRQAGLSQEVLAHETDVDRTYPSMLERGLRQPTITVLLALGRALRTEPETLVHLTARRLKQGAGS